MQAVSPRTRLKRLTPASSATRQAPSALLKVEIRPQEKSARRSGVWKLTCIRLSLLLCNESGLFAALRVIVNRSGTGEAEVMTNTASVIAMRDLPPPPPARENTCASAPERRPAGRRRTQASRRLPARFALPTAGRDGHGRQGDIGCARRSGRLAARTSASPVLAAHSGLAMGWQVCRERRKLARPDICEHGGAFGALQEGELMPAADRAWPPCRTHVPATFPHLEIRESMTS